MVVFLVHGKKALDEAILKAGASGARAAPLSSPWWSRWSEVVEMRWVWRQVGALRGPGSSSDAPASTDLSRNSGVVGSSTHPTSSSRSVVGTHTGGRSRAAAQPYSGPAVQPRSGAAAQPYSGVAV